MVGVKVIATLEHVLNGRHLCLRISPRGDCIDHRQRALGAAKSHDDTQERQGYQEPCREMAFAQSPRLFAARRRSFTVLYRRNTRWNTRYIANIPIGVPIVPVSVPSVAVVIPFSGIPLTVNAALPPSLITHASHQRQLP